MGAAVRFLTEILTGLFLRSTGLILGKAVDVLLDDGEIGSLLGDVDGVRLLPSLAANEGKGLGNMDGVRLG